MSGTGPPTPPDNASGGESLLRQTLAERLHDGPLQDLVALRLKVALLRQDVTTGVRRASEQLVELDRLVETAIARMHAIIGELSDVDAQRADLYAQMVALCDEFRASSGLECHLEIEREHMRFNPAICDVLHRTVRELLTNVHKHARATRVRVSSGYRDDGAIAIRVEDNGIGISKLERRANPFVGGGFGLWSIKHRLSSFNASLELESDAGLRATIVVARRLLIAND